MLQRLGIASCLGLVLTPLACGETPPASGGAGATGGAASSAGVSGGWRHVRRQHIGSAGTAAQSGSAGMQGCALGQTNSAGLSGSRRETHLFGDVEYRGQGTNTSSGSFSGLVDNASASADINDVTVRPPYTWR